MSIINSGLKFVSKNKSTILTTLSIVLGVGAAGWACKQTLKMPDILDEHNKKLDELDEESEDIKKEKTKIYTQTAVNVAKNYAGPIAVGASAVICELKAFNILSNEKAAALTALSAVSSSFTKYRSRVVDRFGAQVDYDLYNGKKIETVEETITDEKGKTKTVKKEVVTFDPIDGDCYKKLYSWETSSEWVNDDRRNRARLKFQQEYWNAQLKAKGYVTYNEVIESLGFSRKVGTFMTEDFIPNGIGWVSEDILTDDMLDQYDTHISFGIPEEKEWNVFAEAGHNGDAMWLTFNCYPIDDLLAAKAANVKKSKA